MSAPLLALAGLLTGFCGNAGPVQAQEVRLEPVAFETLAGFDDDDLASAWIVFRHACEAMVSGTFGGTPPPTGLARICRDARTAPADLVVRDFLRDHFEPHVVRAEPPTGLLTGYYEPELAGSLVPTAAFAVPLLARPDPTPEPFPTRAEIENGALGASARPIVYLRDAVDAFVVHVQGSTRVRLPDGALVRVAFDGRNGHPYSSIGRLLAQRLDVPPAALTADRLSEWLRANPDEGRALMRQNRSYIFFRLETGLDPAQGPIGAAGLPLTPGRSLAVDKALWPYGLPVWLAGPAGSEVFPHGGRLVVAQDTGAAIVGPMRGDLFVGTGREAGAAAGRLRERIGFVVLWPKGDPLPAWAQATPKIPP